MKKYKLLKKYPSIPKRMEAGDEVNFIPSMELYSHDNTLDTFEVDEVETNPEFWKEIFVPNFEVMSFSYGNPVRKVYFRTEEKTTDFPYLTEVNVFRSKQKNRGILTDARLSDKLCHSPWEGRVKIESIKRLADGEILSVGDRVALHKSWETSYCVIDELIVNKNGSLKIWIDENGDRGSYSKLDKFYIVDRGRQQASGITEDGVKLKVGDPYWFVWIGGAPARGQKLNVAYKVNSFTHSKDTFISNNALWFSTEEAAEKYLESIKPPVLFTTDDGVEIYEGDEYFRVFLSKLDFYEHKTVATLGYNFKYMAKKAKHFSTKEKALEYILMNKPCLSINDIINNTCFKFQTVVDELKRKAEENINNK